eukprot:gnl/MRDRNA2_/MRDRNA2_162078_c0_seq1.p1 gnl/MRDRNA2_/MRDRNA2_162078_c0~~gnl/MRDRNA2_/MRDRNA2_162078_c0_seq1.p1  ORF type:complete len:292 (+),score=16.97 gnl/MRDRNA2_/MRDRNA2_162078_c0_seq1:68-943(+)
MACPLIDAFKDVRPWVSQDLEKLRVKMEPVFFFVPLDLKEGPWSLSCIMFLVIVGGLVLATAPYAALKISALPEARSGMVSDIATARFASGILGLSLLGWMWKKYGWWPALTWTMLGWEIATLRYLSGALGLRALQRVLTFPSLLVNTITVVVWHAAMVPAMVYLLTKSTGKQASFLPLVCSPLLLTVHVFNMPWAYIDWYIQPVKITFFDLWVGMVLALSYLGFYLAVLENLGVHFYVILSPRKWWGSIVYSVILLVVFQIWKLFSYLGPDDGSATLGFNSTGSIQISYM